MSMPDLFKNRLSVPVIAAPMFIVSQPDLVIAECRAGVVGSFPSLNARAPGALEEWLIRLRRELTNHDAPFATNLIVHKTNTRLEEDLALCVKYQVPVVISSLGARPEVNEAVHSYGGIVFHDIINDEFAHKAIERGADGLVAVAAGAGGHAGSYSPFALVQEIREWFSGPLALSGAIANGNAIAAARAMGADLAYIGSAFIATEEANAASAYKQMVVESAAKDILYTNVFTGVHGNYLAPSIAQAGIDPAALRGREVEHMDFGSAQNPGAKAWKDIWGSGQGIGAVKNIVPAARLVERLAAEYRAALERLATEG
ncbi:nitronate monooxygenase family protein [Acidocella sp.]|uniref:NAD(P)H-dependent flavin oxidoreductase n=1 Tax=Acidocella sp. TaxID=50710 RepID=UPI0026303DE9|nr:nitronate monooxygenase family protein [Acidocella sp.]